MKLDNFLKNNFPNFYYQEAVYNKMFKLCKCCKLTYSKKELKDGICRGCESMPIIDTTKEKIIFIIVAIVSLIFVLFVLISIRK